MELKKFLIKKGENSSGSFFKPFIEIESIAYNVIFNNTCLYKSYLSKQIVKNNLFGFKFGFGNKNSAEFSWSCRDNKIIIGATCYKNGIKYVRELCELDINKPYILKIENLGLHYEFSISNEKKEITFARIHKPDTCMWGFRTFPNFHTHTVSPQDIEIEMEKIH